MVGLRRGLMVLLAAMVFALGGLPLQGVAAACPDPGGATIPPAEDAPGDVSVNGRGWGHGVGMSQYGAQGAALLGCSAAEILSVYFPGTELADVSSGDDVWVGLYPDAPNGEPVESLRVEAETDDLAWQVLSGTDVDTVNETQPVGDTWRVSISDGHFVLEDDDGEVFEAENTGGAMRVPLRATQQVHLPGKGHSYARGDLYLRSVNGDEIEVTVRLDSVEEYMYGLMEVPSSWPEAALEAQAITGRSYAVEAVSNGVKNDCQCHLWDSPSDQVYAGLSAETGNWPDAVDASPGRILTYQGDVAIGYYSSTHGGQSEGREFSDFFGDTPIPYLQPVDDSYWESASSSDTAGVRTWSQGYSFEEIGDAFDVGVATGVRTPDPKGAGDRIGVPDRGYGGVVIEGTEGEVTVSGLEFVNTLGVERRSERFTVSVDPDSGDGSCDPTVDQTGNELVDRASGTGRVETAVAVSTAHWAGADDVVLATAGEFPDALSAGALAARLDAPVLLTPTDELTPELAAEIERLGAATAHVLGGSQAVSDTVAASLADLGLAVQRHDGPSRVETSAQAALAAGPSASGDVALAYAGDWPDAVSAGALSASADRIPTLLTMTDEVPDTTLSALAELDAERVLLVGGTAVISDAAASQLSDAGYAVERVSGPSRWETSIAAAAEGLRRGEPSNRPVILASGEEFPDALAAGGLAANTAGTVLLTPQCNLNPVNATRDYLADTGFGYGIIVGGTAAVSDRVREQATELLESGSAGASGQDG